MDRIIGWAAAFFFLVATFVLGYSGGLRAQTLANAAEANSAVRAFSIIIGSIFGFMMPFGAVVGMSRGGFLWHLACNMVLGIPLVVGLLLLLIAAFFFYLVDILLSLVTLPIAKIFSIIAGFAGMQLDDVDSDRKLKGWRLGIYKLVCSAQPPERLRKFLGYIRARVTTFLEEEETKPEQKGLSEATR